MDLFPLNTLIQLWLSSLWDRFVRHTFLTRWNLNWTVGIYVPSTFQFVSLLSNSCSKPCHYIFSWFLFLPKPWFSKLEFFNAPSRGEDQKNTKKWLSIDWNTLCSPKLSGGISLKDPETSNKVFGAKIWWRWSMYYSEAWAQIWHVIYAPTWDKQNLIRFLEDSRGSHIWQSTNQNHSIIQSFIFWEIRDGETIKFFSNSWNQQSPIADLTRTPIL